MVIKSTQKKVIKEVKITLKTPETKNYIPIWHKLTLTVEEASLYSNIGESKLREIIAQPECKFVIEKGNRKLIKRKQFEEYIDGLYVL